MKRNARKLLARSIVAASVLALSGVALAQVNTRSTEDAYADLMRTYETHGGPPATAVQSRSDRQNYAELMRDFDGRLTQRPGTLVGVGSDAKLVTSDWGNLETKRFGRQ